LRPGDVVAGRYTIRERVGRGGAGVVYRAFDEEEGFDVALKTPLPVIARQEKPRKRFSREMRLAARLSHENTVKLFDVGITSGHLPWFTMELVRGRRIRDVMRTDKSMTPQRAIRIAIQILGSLGEAHEIGIVHRDLKPENVFLSDTDFVKVADFGLAVCMADAESVTLLGEAVGTLPYMAPEYLIEGEVGPRMDLHTVGLLLYEMILGSSPFAKMSLREIQLAKQYELPLSRELLHDLGPAAPIVARAVQCDPARRYATAQAMAGHLGEVIGTMELPSAPSAWRNPSMMVKESVAPTRSARRRSADDTRPGGRHSDIFPVEVTPALKKIPASPPSR
jgi:eukaryotic-like serine/threonine-protein kinase